MNILEQKELIIWGVGDIGQDLCNRLLRIKCSALQGFCDNNPGKQGSICCGQPVLSPAEAARKYPNACFLITVYNHTAEVVQQLCGLGIPASQTVIMGKDDPFSQADQHFLEERRRQYEQWRSGHSARIARLKGRYAGKRCFIIGTGGSLRNADLERLKTEYTFGCNRLYKLFPQLDWRPTFYCFYDIQRAKLIRQDMPYILDNCGLLFTSSGIKDELNQAIVEDKRTYLLHVEKEKYYPDLPRFSEDVTQCVYDGQTVLYMAAQIAVYLGFTEILYLGADNQYSVELNPDGSIRRNEGVKDYPDAIGSLDLTTSVVPQMELTTRSFQAVRQYADSHGIRVRNATRGGKLEVFDRVLFDTLF